MWGWFFNPQEKKNPEPVSEKQKLAICLVLHRSTEKKVTMTDPAASPANPTIYSPRITNNIVLGIDSISVYDGTSSVEEFLGSIDETALIADWTEQQKVAIARLK